MFPFSIARKILFAAAGKRFVWHALAIPMMWPLCGCDTKPSYTYAQSDRQDGTTNIETLQPQEPEVPPLDQWWMDTPSPDDLIRSLVPAAESESEVCVKRLWISREIDPATNFDATLAVTLEKTATGPHCYALLSHYHQQLGDVDKAQALMDQARAGFAQQPFVGRVDMPYRTRGLLSAVFSLDWIRWKNLDEFESAYQHCRGIMDAYKISGGFRSSGYWANDPHIEHADMVYTLLALCVCDVNPAAESTRWAREHLAKIGQPVESPDSIYSPFRFANVMSLVGRKGGGREMGQNIGYPSFGGYEGYFASSAIVQFRAVDTATNGHWKMVSKSRYLQTRSRGLVFEQDASVSKTGFEPTFAAMIQIMGKLCEDEGLAGLYQWCIADAPPSNKMLEFQCMAGPPTQPLAPEPVPTVRQVGSRWHYRENPAEPDSTFRMWFVNRDLENYRIAPEERCLSFCIGKIGLVDAQANRSYIVGGFANGVQFASRNKNGEPFIADRSMWPNLACHHPYWSSDRAKDDESVRDDSVYLVGTGGPVEVDGIWTWDRDYSDLLTTVLKSPINGKIKHARATFRFDPSEKRLEIIDTIRADRDVYVGWHFSPSHLVTLEGNGFRFGDGTDEIVVEIEGIDQTKLDVKRRKEWAHDGYNLRLDWHDNDRRPSRIAENVGYTPTQYQDEYKVRVVIQANPK
tara:strand:- start:12196 stop:14259 length:2064 start_codon:yes stop_codon:yes gene_type:complete